MQIEIKIPGVGESVKEAVLAQWFKADGDHVKRDEPLFVIETDKVSLEINAEADGILKILAAEGAAVAIGAVVGHIMATEVAEVEASTPPELRGNNISSQNEAPPVQMTIDTPRPQPAVPPEKEEELETGQAPVLSPSVRGLLQTHGLDARQIPATGPGGRMTRGDILTYLEQTGGETAEKPAPPPEAFQPAPPPSAPAEPAPPSAPPSTSETPDEPEITRKPMTPIRKKIAARLLEARRNTAMLTTFNEIDMQRLMDIRAEFKDAFLKKHNVNLGFMSFFVKATVQALVEFSEINAFIEGEDIVYHHYYHIGMAIGSPKGLVVPVIRHADRLGFAAIEQAIVDYVAKIKDNKLSIEDMEGGTFTISNGGVFGSLLSTPILNTPQSGILGMHKIEKRPVVVDDQIVIRPMMYVALSYDHRIVDGREAVTFLKRIKEFIETPERMLMEI